MLLNLRRLLLLKDVVMKLKKLIALVFTGSLMAGSVLSAPKTIQLPEDQSKLRESSLPGYALALQKCGICHSADYINYQPPGQSLAQWTAEVEKMQHSYGAPLNETDITVIGAYLAVAYGSAKASDAGVIAASALIENESVNTTSKIDVQELLKANACLGCHAIEHKVVGPAFVDVAKKYRGEAKAQATVAASIQQGSSGKWGAMAMPPMAGLSDAQAKALAAFVLGQ
jgi:cytochrome c